MSLYSVYRSDDVDVMMSYTEYVKVTNYLREMLCQVCDHAHDRCVKLLVARARVSLPYDRSLVRL